MGDNIHVMLVFHEGWLCICVMHEIIECLCFLMLDYDLCEANPQWSLG